MTGRTRDVTPEQFIERGREVLEVETSAVAALTDRVGGSFAEAAAAVLGCTGRVVVTGIGKSGIIGRKIAATLASTGTPALFMHPAEGLHGDLGMVTSGDVVLVLSNSGEQPEMDKLMPSLRRIGVTVIAMTGSAASTLGRGADIVLDSGVEREACPLDLSPTASTTAMLALGDALAMAVLSGRDFEARDYAVFHPGGSLGRRLMLRVREVMLTGDAVPTLGPDCPMREVARVISEGRLGHGLVVDEAGAVVGIISDGDLRRAMLGGGDPMRLCAADVMTRGPKTISGDALAIEALEEMEQRAIMALAVLDGEGRPEGIVHLHDLMGRAQFRIG